MQVTDETGVYSFGPLDASKQYTITAEKDSYVFGERQENGDIPAHKLAEIIVKLVDKADQSPLEVNNIFILGNVLYIICEKKKIATVLEKSIFLEMRLFCKSYTVFSL